MKKSEIHALSVELSKAVIDEIQVYDFTEDEAEEIIYNTEADEEYLQEAFDWVLEIFREDGEEFTKAYYPATYKAMMHILPYLSDKFLSAYNLNHNSTSLFEPEEKESVMKGIVINTSSNGYSMSQVPNTVTVKELISILQKYDENLPVFLGNDRQPMLDGWHSDSWYSFGGITESDIEEHEEELERTYVVCEECWSWNNKEFISSKEEETFFDRCEAIAFAYGMNESHFVAWSDCSTGPKSTRSKYICYCIKVFDGDGILCETIEADELGSLKK